MFDYKMSEDYRASQDLFEDSLPLENSQHDDSKVDCNKVWKGVDLDSLRLLQYNLIPNVVPSAFHTITFKLPLEKDRSPQAYPKQFQDVWDDYFVRMPCSEKNFVYIAENQRVPAWPMIKDRLTSNISCSTDLEQAITSYAWKKGYQKWNFIALRKFFSETLSEVEAEYFFSSVLPGIVDLALNLDTEVTAKIPLLRKHKSFNISITQRQAACILANAFLCTFPERNFMKENNSYPSINFTRIFLQGGQVPQEKLKCFINYFRQACSSKLDGVISFSRRSINPTNVPSWLDSNKKFPLLHVTSEGTIDNDGQGLLQIDFANKMIGGGVLGYGCVQEEILFLICPELIVARLFTECFDDTECLIITGAEMFNHHTGYAENFKWVGNYEDTTPRDSYKRRCRTVIALDALHFGRNTSLQYKPEYLFREINKAYCGFSFGCDGNDKLSIATGNWGCGVYRGDPKLKVLIQLIASAQSERNLAYFTFYDNELCKSIFDMYSFLIRNDITVGQLCTALSKYHVQCSKIGNLPLYDYLYSYLLKIDTEFFGAIIDKEECNDQSVSGEKTNDKTPNVVNSKNIETNKSNVSVSSKTQETCIASEGCSSTSSFSSEKGKQIQRNESTDEIMDDSNLELPLMTSEPLSAETYSLETEEGKKRCLESEKERWQAYENAKTRLTPSSDSPKPPPKKKISDYFSSTPKRT